MFHSFYYRILYSASYIFINAILCLGYELSLTSITSTEAHVNFNPLQTTDSVYVFAIASLPKYPIQSITINAIDSSNPALYTIMQLQKGWMGAQYLYWFKLTKVSSNVPISANPINASDHLITIVFSVPIPLSNRSYDNTSILHNKIIVLPIPHQFRSAYNTHSSKPPLLFGNGLRLEIAETGLYYLTGEMLKIAGIPIQSIPSRLYTLFNKNRQIPIYISNNDHTTLYEHDTIVFYAEQLYGTFHKFESYSNTNCYWLCWEGNTPGRRVSEFSGWHSMETQIQNPLSPEVQYAEPIIDTAHIEQDNDICFLGNVTTAAQTQSIVSLSDTADIWYWFFIGAEKLTSAQFELLSPLSSSLQNIRLIASLTGQTSIASNPVDHQFSILCNNKSINSEPVQWDGQNTILYTSNLFESNRLNHGSNMLTFSKIQPDSTPDRAAVNWVKIIYERGFRSLHNAVSFPVTNKNAYKWVQYTFEDFTTPYLELWDIETHRKFTGMNINKNNLFYTLTFQDSTHHSSRYLIQPVANRKPVISMTIDTIKNVGENLDGIDYIMLSTDSLLTLLDPLIAYHQNSGLRVKAFDIQDIYNRFSYGIRDPECIKLFLSYIFLQNQSRPPRFLLLAGDASHDMDKKDPFHNVVPTHLSRIPNWGPASNDDYFCTLNGEDLFADMCVGRFPARNKKDLSILVEKTLAYLRNPQSGYWKDNLLL